MRFHRLNMEDARFCFCTSHGIASQFAQQNNLVVYADRVEHLPLYANSGREARWPLHPDYDDNRRGSAVSPPIADAAVRAAAVLDPDCDAMNILGKVAPKKMRICKSSRKRAGVNVVRIACPAAPESPAFSDSNSNVSDYSQVYSEVSEDERRGRKGNHRLRSRTENNREY